MRSSRRRRPGLLHLRLLGCRLLWFLALWLLAFGLLALGLLAFGFLAFGLTFRFLSFGLLALMLLAFGLLDPGGGGLRRGSVAARVEDVSRKRGRLIAAGRVVLTLED